MNFFGEFGKKIIVTMAVFICVLVAGRQASASESVSLRVISTTDIHSQVNDEDYDVAGKSYAQSLARLSTMIKGAREEITEGTSITVDVGDDIYGFGAETVMGGELPTNHNIQPVFLAMKQIGYDVITLGNHDFDYGYDYIKQQLGDTGLDKVCVVANAKDLATGKYPWERTKMLTKEVTTSKGNQIELKIGIVAVTRQELSTYYDYNGILQGESILKTVREQAAALKKQGADVVIAMAHCGFGNPEADDSSSDPGYALTKIKDVDCVILGHQHRNYPSMDSNVKFVYEYPGVDKETGLINGKPVTMVADHAAGIGVADLKLKIDGEKKVSVTGAGAGLRYCSAFVPLDEEITKVTDAYDSLIRQVYEEELAKVKEPGEITGYFPMLEDNYAVQLDNEAKIRFGMSYIHSSAGKNYSKYHVIAATNLFLDGSEGKEDYLCIGNNFTMKDVLNTQQYLHANNYAYWITGAQVREWLEWSAGIFAKSGEKITSDEVLKKLTDDKEADSLLSDGWLEHYDRYVIIDGLEYEIDASVPPRYNYYGDLLDGNARRITRLTYNGEEVADDSRFILVDSYKAKGTPVIGPFLYNQRLSSREYRCTYYFKEYVKELGSFDKLTNQVDNNWSVTFGDSLRKIVRSSSLSVQAAKRKPWYVDTLEETKERAYYLADFKEKETADTTGPLLVLCPSATVETNRDVVVYVQASDVSGVSRLLCLNGSYDKDAGEWQDAAEIADGAFTVTENGIYSVCAEDGQGNRTVKNIRVSNINRDILQSPSVDKFTNKKTKLTGETQPGFTVLVQMGKENYSAKAAEDGSFRCSVGKHSAGEEISVYVADSSGKVSRMVKSTVLRRGPNVPVLSSVSNKTVTLTGSVNDTNSTILVENGTRVFVPASRGKTIYKGCTRYNKKLGISEAEGYTVDKKGKFSIKIPAQKVSVELIVYGVDTQGRVSLLAKTKVADAAPNKPTVYTVSDGQKYVMGKVPSPEREGTVIVRAGDEKYTGSFGKSGSFVVRTGGLKQGVTISVTATDTKAGQSRTSLTTTSKVVSQAQYKAAAGKSKISVGSVSNRSTTIQGKVSAEGTAYINYGDSCARLTIDKGGSFSYHLPQALSEGEDITVTRHNKTTGELEEVKEVSFHLVKPYEPQLKKKKISTKKTTIIIYGREEATLIVKTTDGSRVVEECSYSKSKKRYVYKVKLPKGEGKVRMYLQNDAGNSKKLEVIRRK